jgi:hypothetical protein
MISSPHASRKSIPTTIVSCSLVFLAWDTKLNPHQKRSSLCSLFLFHFFFVADLHTNIASRKLVYMADSRPKWKIFGNHHKDTKGNDKAATVALEHVMESDVVDQRRLGGSDHLIRLRYLWTRSLQKEEGNRIASSELCIHGL